VSDDVGGWPAEDAVRLVDRAVAPGGTRAGRHLAELRTQFSTELQRACAQATIAQERAEVSERRELDWEYIARQKSERAEAQLAPPHPPQRLPRNTHCLTWHPWQHDTQRSIFHPAHHSVPLDT